MPPLKPRPFAYDPRWIGERTPSSNVSHTRVVYAGLGRRCLAGALDLVLFSIPVGFLYTWAVCNIAGSWYSSFLLPNLSLAIDKAIFEMSFSPIHEELSATFRASAGTAIAALIGWLLIAGIYYTVCQSSSWQATIGKKLLSLYVGGEDGQRLTLRGAAWRFALSYLSFLFLGAGYFIALLTKKRQAFHDLALGTFVIKK